MNQTSADYKLRHRKRVKGQEQRPVFFLWIPQSPTSSAYCGGGYARNKGNGSVFKMSYESWGALHL